MSDQRPEQDWFLKGDQDLEMARRALGPGNPLPGMACYHSQQCAVEPDLNAAEEAVVWPVRSSP